MTKIEEVARAIAEEEQHLGAWETYVRVATVAIRAMRKPNDAMIAATSYVTPDYGEMIDAALAERP